MESERDREEHGQRENFSREAVRVGTLAIRIHVVELAIDIFFGSTRYNDDISLEDAIHTALLTLKEGFEGHMTEKTIEIGVVTVPSDADLAAGKVEGTGREKPTFRKLTEEEVRDYLAM